MANGGGSLAQEGLWPGVTRAADAAEPSRHCGRD